MADQLRDVVCYYHDPVKAPLMRAAVLPTVRELPTELGAHVLRGWLGGPHVRVRLRGPDRSIGPAAGAVRHRLVDHLRDHPDRQPMSSADLLRMSVAAGRAELVAPPYGPFQEDNTVMFEEPDPAILARIPGWPATARPRTSLLHDGLPAVAAFLEETGRSGDRSGARVLAAVGALAAHATAGPGGLEKCYLSYQSHLELHLHTHDKDGRTRAAHDTVWRTYRAPVSTRVTTQLDELAREWLRWSRAARRTAAVAYDEGLLASATWQQTSSRVKAFDDPAVSSLYRDDDLSEFHQTIRDWTRDAAQTRVFEIERFCVNMLYQLLAVCDVTPAERYLAGSLVCRAVEAATGLTWRDRLVPQGATP
jgi:hypothetical protein